MRPLEALRVRIYADCARIDDVRTLAATPYIGGFTTNPTLMRKAGVTDYEAFARGVLEVTAGKPISFEVFADEAPEMKRQALKLAAYGDSVYVKIPITSTRGHSSLPLIRELSASGIRVNVTAVLTERQIEGAGQALAAGVGGIVSVFAGRIADTGRDPVPVMHWAARSLAAVPTVQLLWASTRELLNVFQADQAGCDLITVPPEILAKTPLVGADLDWLSLETVRMFGADAAASGLSL